MKALGWFNLVALLGIALLALVGFSGGGDLSMICLAVFAGSALVVIDVVWLIVAGAVGLTKKQASLTGQHRPQGTDALTLAKYMKNARARGFGDGETERRLLRNGWSGPEIQNARRILKSGADLD